MTQDSDATPGPPDLPATLAGAAAGRLHVVRCIEAPAHLPEWGQQLHDLGFVPGEPVAVLRRAPLGGDPMVVRVGNSTYALRRAEATCVQLVTESASRASVASPPSLISSGDDHPAPALGHK